MNIFRSSLGLRDRFWEPEDEVCGGGVFMGVVDDDDLELCQARIASGPCQQHALESQFQIRETLV